MSILLQQEKALSQRELDKQRAELAEYDVREARCWLGRFFLKLFRRV